MSNPFDSVGNMFKVQVRAVIGFVVGVIAGVVLGITVGWKVGLIAGLVIVGLSVIYAAVAGVRAAKSAFGGVANTAQGIIDDVGHDINEASTRRPTPTAFPAFPPMQYGQTPFPQPGDYRDVAMGRVNDLRAQKKDEEEE